MIDQTEEEKEIYGEEKEIYGEEEIIRTEEQKIICHFIYKTIETFDYNSIFTPNIMYYIDDYDTVAISSTLIIPKDWEKVVYSRFITMFRRNQDQLLLLPQVDFSDKKSDLCKILREVQENLCNDFIK